mgnify:FL=1
MSELIVEECGECGGRGYAVDADGDGKQCRCRGTGCWPGRGMRRDELNVYADHLADLAYRLRGVHTRDDALGVARSVRAAAATLIARLARPIPSLDRSRFDRFAALVGQGVPADVAADAVRDDRDLAGSGADKSGGGR